MCMLELMKQEDKLLPEVNSINPDLGLNCELYFAMGNRFVNIPNVNTSSSLEEYIPTELITRLVKFPNDT